MSERKGDFRRLYRSRQDRVLAGVCGGLADYFDIDSAVVRLLTVISFFFFGFGFLLYVAAIFIIPENPNHVRAAVPEDGKRTEPRGNWNLAVGAVMVIFGALLLLDEFDILEHGWFRFNFFPWRLFWPLLLLGLGIYFVTSGTSISKTAGDVKQWARESRISKSREDKMLAGVCGGLARYFNIDSSVIRIIAVIVAIFSGGLGVLAYIVMALIFPFADEVPGGSGREAENGNGPSSKG